MQKEEESELYKILQDTLLPGQEGIKTRAFLAFNRGNPLVNIENCRALAEKGIIEIKDDTLYPLETL